MSSETSILSRGKPPFFNTLELETSLAENRNSIKGAMHYTGCLIDTSPIYERWNKIIKPLQKPEFKATIPKNDQTGG
jgi:hypothetical protein